MKKFVSQRFDHGTSIRASPSSSQNSSVTARKIRFIIVLVRIMGDYRRSGNSKSSPKSLRSAAGDQDRRELPSGNSCATRGPASADVAIDREASGRCAIKVVVVRVRTMLEKAKPDIAKPAWGRLFRPATSSREDTDA